MSSGRFSHAFRLRLSALALGAVIALCGAAAAPAQATHFAPPPPGSTPLDIWIGKDGWFQELVEGNSDKSFFPPLAPEPAHATANAGFVLAFPNVAGTQPSDPIEGQVWGWDHDEGASDLDFNGFFNPISQDASWAGTGTSDVDPYVLVTVYEVDPAGATPALVRVTQTTTYVNGEFDFVNSYAVENLTAGPLQFRALIGADVFLNGSDCGTGIFKTGPPRFVGGFSNGRVGGFTEAGTPWTTYFEGQYGGPPGSCQQVARATGVWDYLEGAHSGSGFPSSPPFVDTNLVDNGIGIQWDTNFTTPLAAFNPGDTDTALFQLNTLGTVPGTLSLAPSSQSVNAGTPATLTATAIDSAGAPAAGLTVRFTASGANIAGGSATTNGSGQATLTYTPTSGGTDTVTAFEDIDGNGGRGTGEPSATATVTVAGGSSGGPGSPGSGSSDKTPPKLTLSVSSKVKLKKFLKGLSVGARVNETASLKLELHGSIPKGKVKAKGFTKLLARQSLPTAGAGLRATRLRPKKKTVGKAKKFSVRLRVTATDRAGNKTVVTRTIKVR